MINRKLIPELGMFEVTTTLIDSFYEIYSEVNSLKNSNTFNTKKSNVRYAKKLAGLSLMKLNLERCNIKTISKVKSLKPKSGIVYLISNPIFPGMYKIGMTQDLGKRLSQYQTCDPYRRYKVEHYKFVEDRKAEEKKYLEQMKVHLVKGEWVSSERVKDLFIGM